MNTTVVSNYHTQEKQKIQSMEWLVSAILTLMKDYDFEDITITLICKQADLSRRTFYRLFSTKEDLIQYKIKSLCLQYNNLFSLDTDKRLPNVTSIFFAYWSKQKDFLLLLKKNHLEHHIHKVFSEMLPKVYENPEIKPIQTENQLIRYYMAIFCAGGYATLLMEWVNGGCKEDSSFMKTVMDSIIHMSS